MSHPLKALNHLAHLIVSLIYELSKPETWSKMGAGMMGAGCGQALVTGNPLSVIGLLVGSLMLSTGLCFGALKAAFNAEKGEKLSKAKAQALSQLMQLPESFLTGFFMGLLVGGIQRAVYENKAEMHKQANYQKAKQYTDEFMEGDSDVQINIEIEIDGAGNVVVKLESFYPDYNSRYIFQSTLSPEGATFEGGSLISDGQVYDLGDFCGFDSWADLEIQSSFTEPLIPTLPQDVAFSNSGAVMGAFPSLLASKELALLHNIER